MYARYDALAFGVVCSMCTQLGIRTKTPESSFPFLKTFAPKKVKKNTHVLFGNVDDDYHFYTHEHYRLE